MGNNFGTLNDVNVYSSCYSPPPPKPGPAPPAPAGRPPNPAPGQCVAVPNVTLLSTVEPGGLPGYTLTDSAAGCMQHCEADACCRAYTWHDSSCGSFFRQCYLITSLPDGDDPWQWAARYIGHQSGLCNHSNVEPKPTSCSRTKNTCQPASVVCAATNVSQVCPAP